MASILRRGVLIAVAALAASCTARQPAVLDQGVAMSAGAPETVAQAFYQTHLDYMSAGEYGLPGPDWVARYAPAITPELRDLMLQADAAETQFNQVAASRDEPPLIEGDPFSSLFEGYTAFTVEPCEGDDQQRQCPVRLTYSDSVGTTEWHDAATVVQTPQGWRVADIEFRGDWDFATRGHLTQSLASVIATPPSTD